MADIHQVIVCNIPEQGLDVVATTLHRSQIPDISLFVPEQTPYEFNKVFLTKFQRDNVILRFTFDDGIDQYGRECIKTHTLIVKSSFYNEMTAQYFISPLINGTMNVEENNLLKQNDFELLESFPVSSKLIELVLCKKHIQLTTQEKFDTMELIQTFGTVDRVIPPPFSHLFSFQTMVSSGAKKTYQNHSLVFSLEKLPHSQPIEKIQSSKSEFPTIQAISNSVSDLPSLRELQKKLFYGVPEKLLSLRLHWRFGMTTFSQVRENINSYFS
ncbi:MAG: hypothetical protein JSV04_02300 [Candidatus Heimdallarchaeota archaeon]|nr:MAG: hypothetical protein JSV04_02300 [Candidatus Heimdallarchaeota archaeon]